ncbi:hypothetical protein MRX96_048172 [Rhipicephalus microplus]
MFRPRVMSPRAKRPGGARGFIGDAEGRARIANRPRSALPLITERLMSASTKGGGGGQRRDIIAMHRAAAGGPWNRFGRGLYKRSGKISKACSLTTSAVRGTQRRASSQSQRHKSIVMSATITRPPKPAGNQAPSVVPANSAILVAALMAPVPNRPPSLQRQTPTVAPPTQPSLPPQDPPQTRQDSSPEGQSAHPLNTATPSTGFVTLDFDFMLNSDDAALYPEQPFASSVASTNNAASSMDHLTYQQSAAQTMKAEGRWKSFRHDVHAVGLPVHSPLGQLPKCEPSPSATVKPDVATGVTGPLAAGTAAAGRGSRGRRQPVPDYAALDALYSDEGR